MTDLSPMERLIERMDYWLGVGLTVEEGTPGAAVVYGLTLLRSEDPEAFATLLTECGLVADDKIPRIWVESKVEAPNG